VPAFFESAVVFLLAATGVHILFVTLFGQLPRLVGLALIGGYGWFLYQGLPR
jgi:cation:H+ antiporter